MTRKAGLTRSNGNRTRAKILDAAEVLFGAHGFDAVSLREITELAEVTLALANYHFGTKENLFEEVVARRAKILCTDRETRLAALNQPSVRQIADAFLSALFEKATSDTGWPDYFRVIARLGDSERWLPLLGKYFDPTAKIFIAKLQDAMPSADTDAIHRCFAMMLPAMLATASRHARVDQLTDGGVTASESAKAYPVLLDFVTAGLESAQR